MRTPTHDRSIGSLLRYLAEHPDGVRTADAHEAVANALSPTSYDRAERRSPAVPPPHTTGTCGAASGGSAR